MKIMRYLLAAVLVLSIVGCKRNNEIVKDYPELESLTNTTWWSYDNANDIYYDITYQTDNTGVMLGYSEQGRLNEVVNRPFSYTFTPATANINAIVRIDFEDGLHYGGWLAPKGIYQINLQDVYLIQLYETDAEGEVIYNIDGTLKSTLQMWME